MNKTKATAGNNGEKDRSDCFVSLELTSSGGLVIDLTSKVEALYGRMSILLWKTKARFLL